MPIRAAGVGAVVATLIVVGFASTAKTGSASLLGSPATIPIAAPPAVKRTGGSLLAEFREGRAVAAQPAVSPAIESARLAIADRATRLRTSAHGLLLARSRALVYTRPPMPSFRRLPTKRRAALVTFLSLLRRP